MMMVTCKECSRRVAVGAQRYGLCYYCWTPAKHRKEIELRQLTREQRRVLGLPEPTGAKS